MPVFVRRARRRSRPVGSRSSSSRTARPSSGSSRSISTCAAPVSACASAGGVPSIRRPRVIRRGVQPEPSGREPARPGRPSQPSETWGRRPTRTGTSTRFCGDRRDRRLAQRIHALGPEGAESTAPVRDRGDAPVGDVQQHGDPARGEVDAVSGPGAGHGHVAVGCGGLRGHRRPPVCGSVCCRGRSPSGGATARRINYNYESNVRREVAHRPGPTGSGVSRGAAGALGPGPPRRSGQRHPPGVSGAGGRGGARRLGVTGTAAIP